MWDIPKWGIKWWHLKGEKQKFFQQNILEGGFMKLQGSVNYMWDKKTYMIRKVAKETLENQYVFDPRVKNLSGGVEMFKVKLESKGNVPWKGVMISYIRAIKVMYEGVSTKTRTHDEDISDFFP
jgi:hypothetical protein